jgi:hypothetical protein
VRRIAEDFVRITFDGLETKQRFVVKLQPSAARFGTQWMFQCPETGAPSRVLYYLDGRLGCRSALGLSFSSQSMSPVDRALRRKEKLIRELERPRIHRERRRAASEQLSRDAEFLARNGEAHADALVAVQLDAEKRRRGRVRIRSFADVMGTAAALSRGRGIAWQSSHTIRWRLDKNLRSAQVPQIPETTPRAPAQGFPELDIRDLRQGQGRPVAMCAAWPTTPWSEEQAIRLRVDLRRRRIIVELGNAVALAPYQVIELEPGQGKDRWYMRCPISGERRLKLYLRNGFFGDHTTHNLARPSEWNDGAPLSPN